MGYNFMSEEVTAGGKEFVFALVWAAVLYFVCGIIMSAFKSYFFIGAVISLLMFCVFGFFVMTRYASRFTYTLKDGSLRINRMIGKRNKEVEFHCSAITGMYYGYRPASFPRRPYNMRKSILSGKRLLYIEYKASDGTRQGVVIEPSDRLRNKIDRERNKSDKND